MQAGEYTEEKRTKDAEEKERYLMLENKLDWRKGL